jgi:hypothetical protein
MKKTIVITSLILSLCLPTQAQNWQVIGQSEDLKTYIDLQSLSNPPGVYECWVKFDIKDKKNSEAYKYILFTTSDQYYIAGKAIYNKEGRLKRNKKIVTLMNQIAPGSFEQQLKTLLNNFFQNKNTTFITPQFTPFENPDLPKAPNYKNNPDLYY